MTNINIQPHQIVVIVDTDHQHYSHPARVQFMRLDGKYVVDALEVDNAVLGTYTLDTSQFMTVKEYEKCRKQIELEK